MSKYVTQMSKSGESQAYFCKDAEARTLIGTEATDRAAAVAAEATARESADTEITEMVFDNYVESVIDESLLESGTINNNTGANSSSSSAIRTIGYLDDSVLKINTTGSAMLHLAAYLKSNDTYQGFYNGTNTLSNNGNLSSIDMARVREWFPTCKFRLVIYNSGGSSVTTAYNVNAPIRYSKIFMDKKAAAYNFEQGGISNVGRGEGYVSSKHIRSKYYLSDGIAIVKATGTARFRVCGWQPDGTYAGMLTDTYKWLNTGTYHKNVDLSMIRTKYTGYRFKLVVSDSTEADINPGYASNVMYKSLTVAEEVEYLNVNLFNTESANSEDFQSGGISNMDGTEYVSSTLIRSINYLPDGILAIKAENTSRFRVCGWQADGTYAGMLSLAYGWSNAGTYHTFVDLLKVQRMYQGYKFRIVIGDTDGVDIAASYASNVKYTVYAERKRNEKQDKRLDALESAIETISEIGFSLPGKVMVGLGDSIMYGSQTILQVGDGSFIEYIADLLSADAVNYSRGGARIGGSEHSYDIWKQVDTLVASGNTPDYVIFNGGINDVYSSETDPEEDDKEDDEGRTPLGTITVGYDPLNFDTDTFSGAFEYILYNLKTNFPNAKIIYMTTHNAGSRDYNQQVTYRQRALDICEKYSVRVADIYKYSNMNTNIQTDRNAFTRVTQSGQGADGTHPNRAGYTTKYLPVVLEQVRFA